MIQDQTISFTKNINRINPLLRITQKLKNIPKKRILALEEMEGIVDFNFNADGYWSNGPIYSVLVLIPMNMQSNYKYEYE